MPQKNIHFKYTTCDFEQLIAAPKRCVIQPDFRRRVHANIIKKDPM